MADRKEALIISEDLFKALSPISGDLDWQYIWPNILATQDKWIQPLLGQKLYEKIMADIDAETLIDPYLKLVDDFVARTTVWYSCYLGLPFWGMKVVNSGVVQRVVDDSTPMDLSDIDKIATRCRGNAEFYSQRLIDYLCANSDDYPEYVVCESGEVPAQDANYTAGLNLDNVVPPKRRNDWYKR